MTWPSPESLPRHDAPPIVWARWYRDRCGWIVLPTPAPADIIAIRDELARRSIADAESRRGRRLTAEERAAEVSFATAKVERRSKGPLIGWPKEVSDDDIERWWGPRAEAGKIDPGDGSAPLVGHLRGIFVLCAQVDAKRTAPIVSVIDVDPRSGGEVDAWRSESDLISSTPGGGVHCWYKDPALDVPARSGRPGEAWPGIDCKGFGGGVVVPSGLSSPSRRWLSWSEAADLSAQARSVIAARRAGGGTGGGVGTPTDKTARAAGTFGRILQSPVGDGQRNATAAAIVGMLARPSSIPEDSLDAALDLLRESWAQEARGAEDIASMSSQWRSLLTRGPRTVEHAVSFILAWNDVRCADQWPARHAEQVARSLWKTADRRESGGAGAEDLGAVEWSLPDLPELTDEEEEHVSPSIEPTAHVEAPAIDSPPALVPASAPAPALRLPKSPTVETPEEFGLPLSVARSIESIRAARAECPIGIDVLPPWIGWDERPDQNAIYGYGVGPWLNAALGRGLRRGSFVAVGALTPKGGKTAFVGQIIEGLLIQSAHRILGAAGEHLPWDRQRCFADDGGPIFMAFWLTEMERHVDLDDRMIGRYLEIDWSFIGSGVDAHLAPGVQAAALKYGQDARVMATATDRRIERHLQEDGVLAVARSLATNFDPLRLPKRKGGRFAENPRLGARLVDRCVSFIERKVATSQDLLGVDPSMVIPILVLDPVHRFIDASGEDRLTAINDLTSAMRDVAHERKWIVFFTNDTTKGTATGDKDMHGDPTALAAAAMAGSQELAHQADTVLVIHADHSRGNGVMLRTVPVLARVCMSRRAPVGPPVPFVWHTHCGRYYAIDPCAEQEIDVPKATPKKIGRPKKGDK